MWWLRTTGCSDEPELREQKLGWSRGRILIWIKWRINHQVGIRFDKMFATTDFIKLNSKRSRCIFCNYKHSTFFGPINRSLCSLIFIQYLTVFSFGWLNNLWCFKFLWTEKKIFFRWKWTIKSKQQALKSIQFNFSFNISAISSHYSPLNNQNDIGYPVTSYLVTFDRERTSQGPFTFAGILASLRYGNQLLASICRPHVLHLYISLVCLMSSSERFSRWPNVLSAPGGSIDPVRWSISWIVGLPFLVKKYSP